MGKKYQRHNGESMAEFRIRCEATEAILKSAFPKPKKPRRRAKRAVVTRNEDPLDKLDYLGLSPDF